MLGTVWEFVRRHILIVFAQGIRNYFVHGAARKVGRRIKEKLFGRKPEWRCSSCDSLFTHAHLYDGFWFARRECPSCRVVGTLTKAKGDEIPVAQTGTVERIYVNRREDGHETVSRRRDDQAADEGAAHQDRI